MANYLDGLPTSSQITTFSDALATYLKSTYASKGLNAPSESATNAVYANTLRNTLVGDGASTYGIQNGQVMTEAVKSAIDTIVRADRYDTFLSSYGRQLVSQMNTAILRNIPSTWTYPTGSAVQPLTAELLRLNSVYHPASASTKPASGTLTATYDATGGLAAGTYRVKFSLVGSVDYSESIPSDYMGTVSVGSTQNCVTLTWASGTIPASVTKIRVYRQLVNAVSATADPYYWDQDVAVTGGTAYSGVIIKLAQPDQSLAQGVRPGSWFGTPMPAEFAAFFSLANSVLQTSSTAPLVGLLPFTSSGMLDPSVVWAPASNSYVGYGNVSAHALYGTKVFGGSYTAGTLLTANNTATNLQGYGGNTTLSARVTSALGATTAMTLSNFDYYCSVQGWGTLRNSVTNGTADFGATTLAGGTFSGTGTGSTATFGPQNDTNGYPIVIRAVNAVTGGPASGTVVIEGKNLRTI